MGQEQIIIKYDELLKERDKWRDLYEDACMDANQTIADLQKAHDNLAQQLSTANNLLETAVEALDYYARNTDKFINWRARQALKEIQG